MDSLPFCIVLDYELLMIDNERQRRIIKPRRFISNRTNARLTVTLPGLSSCNLALWSTIVMRLASLRILNFRCFDAVTIIFDDYTCLVGPNGAGKSTVLSALNVFFRETANASTDTLVLVKEDFHLGDTTKPVEIEATFEELSPDAQEDFRTYFRNGKLVISAVAEWNDSTQTAPVRQYGQRLGIEDFRVYFDKEKNGGSAKDLQQIYLLLKEKYPELRAAKTKGDMEEALHEFEAGHPDDCILIPSEDQFYGVSRGVDRLQKYVQWVYVPAVKDAATEQQDAKNSAISKLLSRRVYSQLNISEPIDALKKKTLEEYQALIDSKRDAFSALSSSLNQRFHKWAHNAADLIIDWQDVGKNVSIATPAAQVRASEWDFKGALPRFGHGLQRAFIFALLQELAEHNDAGPKLIFGCEEPELYQHPPQARYLAGVMQLLSTQNAQVFVSTHSPHFVTGRSFENLRMVRKNPTTGSASVVQATFDSIAAQIAEVTGSPVAKTGGMAAKIEQEMQGPMNEMFFATVRVLVEGIEDIAYISSYLTLMEVWQEFRSYGCHLVQVQGKNHLIEGVAIAKQLDLPTMIVFDCDGDTPHDTPEKKTGRRAKQEADSTALFKLTDVVDADAFPTDILWNETVIAWPTKIGDIVEMDIGKDDLNRIRQQVRHERNIDGSDLNKNSLFIGYVMAEAWAQGKRSPTLEKLCAQIIAFSKPAALTHADSERCRSAFQSQTDHDSELMPIAVPR